MATSLIAFGANQGDRAHTFDEACLRLSRHQQVTLVARSRPYDTAPIGGPPGQGVFLNAALLLNTSLAPQQLLLTLNQIELDLGRERQQRWDQRPIDLDLLLYDDLTIHEANLRIPHSHMTFRRFVLEPAAEIAPSVIHPQVGWSIQQLFDHLCTAENYVALIGPAGSGKTKVAREVCKRLNGHLVLSPPFTVPPAGQSPEACEAKLLEERRRRLANIPNLEPSDANHPGSNVAFALSDFWLEQCRAYLNRGPSQETIELPGDEWKRSTKGALQPKLRVLLDLDNPAGDPPDLALQLALRVLSQQPLQGPLLHLTRGDHSTVVQEVEAAILSMR